MNSLSIVVVLIFFFTFGQKVRASVGEQGQPDVSSQVEELRKKSVDLNCTIAKSHGDTQLPKVFCKVDENTMVHLTGESAGMEELVKNIADQSGLSNIRCQISLSRFDGSCNSVAVDYSDAFRYNTKTNMNEAISPGDYSDTRRAREIASSKEQ